MQRWANPGRSGHRLSVAFAEKVYLTRELLSSYFDGYGAERVIFTKNCTEALNIALFSLKGHVIATELEHNSVLRPLAKRGNYSICPLTDGKLDLLSLRSLVREDTSALVISLASNVTGYAPDVRLIRSILPPNVLIIGDGAQAGGHAYLSMKRLGLDALCLAGHKGLFGIQGSGVLLFSDRFSPSPLLYGGTGTESFNRDMPSCYPERLEAGTLNFPAIVSLYEGVLYLKTHGVQDESMLSKTMHELLSPLVTLYSEPNSYGIVTFSSEKYPSEAIAAKLNEYDIAVRGGLHCAPLIHERIDRHAGGSVRVSMGYGNTLKEVDCFYRAIKEILT